MKNATDPTVIKGNQKANQKTRESPEAQDTTATIPTTGPTYKARERRLGGWPEVVGLEVMGKSIWAMKKRAPGWLGYI